VPKRLAVMRERPALRLLALALPATEPAAWFDAEDVLLAALLVARFGLLDVL
jgi:hypothetical protein